MTAMESIDIAFPQTLPEALALMADEATRGQPLAGGTDLMVQWESGVRPPPARAIDIKHLHELHEISETHDELVIGGAVTHAHLRRTAMIRHYAPALAEAAATVGGGQIQAMGTIAGSIANASPAGDLAPSLLAADARVVVASVRGERNLSLQSFIRGYRKIDLAPDELIVRFVIPVKKPTEREQFRKLGPRAAQAISKIMGSYRGEIRDGTITRFSVALGSVAPTAVRLPDVEALVVGRTLDAALLDEAERCAAASVKPITDIRSTAEYRQWVSGRLIRGFLEHVGADN
ncbi:MAG TPA: FAD binding domain-containing protein [Kiritimatiellia bacterium]|nr:FAD binding domain-containing protein [Kiritimatiellia bacterium]HMO98168.1 FAD binding domain-containing protein [Kiritimatiellia bacterium]HMP97584.1 FAD binding domain-containing protein [Kiritimatiellia bacterium]